MSKYKLEIPDFKKKYVEMEKEERAHRDGMLNKNTEKSELPEADPIELEKFIEEKRVTYFKNQPSTKKYFDNIKKMGIITKPKEIEILKADGYTESEAEKH